MYALSILMHYGFICMQIAMRKFLITTIVALLRSIFRRNVAILYLLQYAFNMLRYVCGYREKSVGKFAQVIYTIEYVANLRSYQKDCINQRYECIIMNKYLTAGTIV